MSKDTLKLPLARSWRDIPQQVKPRALSREGRRRFAVRGLRLGIGLGVLAAAGWAGWGVTLALRRGAPGDAAPIADHVVPLTDGVLDKGWLVRTLALPPRATLMSIDLRQLQARVLASGQVATAAIVRHFPRELSVHMSERQPVARIRIQKGSADPQTLLVARDGVIYPGACYDSQMVETLPWLDGLKLVPQGAGFAPLAGMAPVADLLAQAQLEDRALYQTWRVVSLARLASDNEIAIRSASGLKVVFGAQDNFFRQLARLDLLLDTAARQNPPLPVREINLALGDRVPVAFAPPAVAPAPGRPAAAASPAPFLFQSHLTREF